MDLKKRGLRLNAYFLTYDIWNKEGILKRANYLIRIALEYGLILLNRCIQTSILELNVGEK